MTPAPDAVAEALDRAEHVARAEMRDCPQHSTCSNCPDTVICQGWNDVDTIARARAAHAAMVKALEAGDMLADAAESWKRQLESYHVPAWQGDQVAAYRAARQVKP